MGACAAVQKPSNDELFYRCMAASDDDDVERLSALLTMYGKRNEAFMSGAFLFVAALRARSMRCAAYIRDNWPFRFRITCFHPADVFLADQFRALPALQAYVHAVPPPPPLRWHKRLVTTLVPHLVCVPASPNLPALHWVFRTAGAGRCFSAVPQTDDVLPGATHMLRVLGCPRLRCGADRRLPSAPLVPMVVRRVFCLFALVCDFDVTRARRAVFRRRWFDMNE